MNDKEWIEQLIIKFNNIQMSGSWLERFFHFNNNTFYVSTHGLYRNDLIATEEQIKEFRGFYQEFNKKCEVDTK